MDQHSLHESIVSKTFWKNLFSMIHQIRRNNKWSFISVSFNRYKCLVWSALYVVGLINNSVYCCCLLPYNIWMDAGACDQTALTNKQTLQPESCREMESNLLLKSFQTQILHVSEVMVRTSWSRLMTSLWMMMFDGLMRGGAPRAFVHPIGTEIEDTWQESQEHLIKHEQFYWKVLFLGPDWWLDIDSWTRTLNW